MGGIIIARGNVAKDNVIKKIQQTFGNDFVGIIDKKLYVWADDGGEQVQIAISMTCPKNVVMAIDEERVEISTGMMTNNEISEEERQKVMDIMKRLNL